MQRLTEKYFPSVEISQIRCKQLCLLSGTDSLKGNKKIGYDGKLVPTQQICMAAKIVINKTSVVRKQNPEMQCVCLSSILLTIDETVDRRCSTPVQNKTASRPL